MTRYLNRARSVLNTFTFALCVGAALTGCKSGGGGDASSPASPATSVPVGPTPPAANNAPTISGTATANVNVSTAYSFAPTATDVDGDALTFQIQNKPAWATFSTVTGQLSGTPSAAGSFADIIISASDGKTSAALPGFTITVTAPPPVQVATTTVSWTAPTENTDGTPLTDLAGFVIAYGQSSTALTQTVSVDNASIDSYAFDQLTKGTYYFAVKAYTSTGVESQLSSVASKVIE